MSVRVLGGCLVVETPGPHPRNPAATRGTRFPTWEAVLNYRGSARGLRFTVSPRIGAGFLGGRKTADFLGERSSVRVTFGIGTAAFECGRKPSGIHRTRSAAQKFFHQ